MGVDAGECYGSRMTRRDDIDPSHRSASNWGGRHLLAVLGLLVLIGLVGVFLLFPDLIRVENMDLIKWINGMGGWGPLALIGLMVLHCFVPFPAEILALSAGALFGVLVGTLLIWVGAMLGAMLSFALARYLGRDAVERMLSPRHRRALEGWTQDQGALTLLISRFIPVIAFNLINYAAGLTRVRWWTFVWTTAVGILPLTMLMVYLGTVMRDLSWELLLMVSAAGIVTIWAGHWLAERQGWLGR